jgi:hypothetical protein
VYTLVVSDVASHARIGKLELESHQGETTLSIYI